MANVTNVELSFFEKAQKLVPKLRERAEETEQLRRLPDETIEDIKKAGFFKLLRPKRYGGFETDIKTYADVVVELSRGCASTGWIVALCGIRELMVAESFSEKTHEEIFGKNPDDVVFAGVYEPRKAEAYKVDGGYFIEEGYWMFCSGSQHATWGYFGLPIRDKDGNLIDQVLMTLPFENMEIQDDWYTFGLKGSGSNAVKMHNVFIPDHRVVSFVETLNGNYQSTHLRDIPLYNTALFPALILSLGLPILGAVKGALDLFLESLPFRKAANLGVEYLKEAPSTHLQISEAKLKIDTAEMHFYRVINDLENWANSGKHMDPDSRVQALAHIGYANQILREALEIIIWASGSGFVYDGNPLQRIIRDVITMNSHRSLSPTITKENYGRILAGLETNNVRF